MMEALIFIGIQATGKSTFYKERFLKSHIRVNLDMLKTRHRENLLLDACIEMKQPFVVDNTNPTKGDRQRYINLAKENKFKIIGYYFSSEISQCLERNKKRPDAEQIPERGIKGTHSKLELPDYAEGFDDLYYVKTNQNGGFQVSAWEVKNEV
jgi:predicted kinase